MHKRVSQNQRGRDFVVGDIHGHFDVFMEELSYEGFNADQDRVFSVGDLIDRGPQSLACLELLDKPWFHAVRGNHEQMMIDWATDDAFPNWQRNYGRWTLDMDADVLSGWVDRLLDLPIAITLEGADFEVGICHAETSGHDWKAMTFDASHHQRMMWGRKILKGEVDTRAVEGVDMTIHGHTPLPQVRRIANRYFVDTGAGDGERLTVRNIAELMKAYRDISIFS